MLVSFIMYLLPNVMMSSILSWSDLVRLKVASTFLLVSGDDLVMTGWTGDMVVVGKTGAVVHIPKKENIKIWIVFK